MKIEFLTPNSSKWWDFINSTPHDFYHLPEYTQLSRIVDKGEPSAILITDGDFGFFLPFLLRQIESETVVGKYDASSPYGYPGPLLRGSGVSAEKFLKVALDKLKSVLSQNDVISLFIRMHPIYKLPEFVYNLPGMVCHGETLFIDLTLSAEQLLKATRRGHSREIEKAEKAGNQIVEIDNWDDYDEFKRIYDQSMMRLQADSYYLYPKEYYSELKETLGDHIHLAVNRIDNEIALMMIFTECCGIIQTHLAGTEDRYTLQHPQKMVHHKVRFWAKERGNKIYHLGGGLGGREDSLFQYKLGFANFRHRFHTWRIILDSKRYQSLITEWEGRSGIEADNINGYFPPYRKGVSYL
jgi:hypothetical protein